jgi:hypothetical protein
MKTFVLRLWIPAEPEADVDPPVLRGFVDEVATGSTRRFVGGEQLVALLEEAVEPSRLRQPVER